MVKLQKKRLLWALAVSAALPLAASSAQQAQPETPPGAAPPEKVAPPRTEPDPPRSEMAPPPSKAPAVKPSEAPAAQDLVGLNVFSADGTRIGEVRGVNTDPSGDIVALHIRTGGFLGFGGRIVAIPQGKFIRSGQSIRLDLDSDQVTGLPEVKDR
jgi:sporulation protein YlmC with PRC-barrel domain